MQCRVAMCIEINGIAGPLVLICTYMCTHNWNVNLNLTCNYELQCCESSDVPEFEDCDYPDLVLVSFYTCCRRAVTNDKFSNIPAYAVRNCEQQPVILPPVLRFTLLLYSKFYTDYPNICIQLL